MSASRDNRLSRRFLLTAPLCAAGPAAAQAPVKVSAMTAKYQASPRDGLRCAACTFFRRPDQCQVVEGPISPNGWCQLFDMPD
jgi:hypothetical protein